MREWPASHTLILVGWWTTPFSRLFLQWSDPPRNILGGQRNSFDYFQEHICSVYLERFFKKYSSGKCFVALGTQHLLDHALLPCLQRAGVSVSSSFGKLGLLFPHIMRSEGQQPRAGSTD